MQEKLKHQIISILDDIQDMTIATVREDNFPQATTVSYVNDGLTIYFATSSDSQKAKNISKNNRVSITINRDYENWNEIESLSIGGTAHLVSDVDEIKEVGKLIFNKFPQVAEYTENESDMQDLDFFRIEPKVISLLDYSVEFGHTEYVAL